MDTFYNFNLLTVFDGDLREIYFKDNEKCPKKITDIKYINRHIINGKEGFFRVHFVEKSIFEQISNCYDDIFISNNIMYSKLIDEFYISLWNNPKKVSILWESFVKDLNSKVYWIAKYDLKFTDINRFENIDYYYNKTECILYLNIDDYYDKDYVLKFLNETSEIINETKSLLLKHFRYTGNFLYDNNYLPF